MVSQYIYQGNKELKVFSRTSSLIHICNLRM